MEKGVTRQGDQYTATGYRVVNFVSDTLMDALLKPVPL